MKQRVPALVGVGGHIKGEVVPLDYSRTITVGRSRKCSYSLRRANAYRDMVKDAGETTESFRTVSGVHFEITMFNTNAIEIINHSINGTVVDGKLQERVVIDDVVHKTHEIRFGAMEVFLLKMEDIEIPEKTEEPEEVEEVELEEDTVKHSIDEESAEEPGTAEDVVMEPDESGAEEKPDENEKEES